MFLSSISSFKLFKWLIKSISFILSYVSFFKSSSFFLNKLSNLFKPFVRLSPSSSFFSKFFWSTTIFLHLSKLSFNFLKLCIFSNFSIFSLKSSSISVLFEFIWLTICFKLLKNFLYKWYPWILSNSVRNCNSLSWCSKFFIRFFLNKNPLIHFCNFIILNIVFHHSCKVIIFLRSRFFLIGFALCLWTPVEYSILLINTAVLSAFLYCCLLKRPATPLTEFFSFTGIGVNEFSGKTVTIFVALFLILFRLPFNLVKQFSKFCGVRRDSFLLTAPPCPFFFFNWIFFK